MTSTMSNWRAAVDPVALREYDRFGPWIDPVEDLDDMPPRFRPWWPELGGSDYVLKVPRHYDRAQVLPGMDLYESVIAVDADRLTVLRAEQREVVRQDVARKDVVASLLHTNLLFGRWSVLLVDGSSLDLEYNSVSREAISAVDRFLVSTEHDGVWTSAAELVAPPKDHLFCSIITDLTSSEHGDVRLVHAEAPDQPCRSEAGYRRRSAGMMILQTPGDLMLFNRTMAVRPLFRRVNYAYNMIRIPFGRMTSFELRRAEPAEPPRFSRLVITCGKQVITQPVLTPPEGVVELLDAHGVPCVRPR